ncbi:P27 family phage terminase small subunit [Nitratidesulfovibrio sp. HK-II]|uniref:P27 family phage terminase small subunit n=1 Tax=unclassified Nitratidesulfovibrio TaxID=2802296 RepID=UPI000E2EA715|nr:MULTISPECIES: P27 family phage terminase small subunit [unclassified Nitratidesulfovibrio]MBZ2172182.1 P27 family phage terminase small subunit [Nitratidesulfovibrio sp. SRB-5]RXF77378.1 P27 family phage terminase small subunit [Desulfovibrio sp. DS-1]
MATGRKQKPRTLKVLQGTFRKDRANEAAPEPSAVVANAPAFLSGRALVWFGVLCAKLSPLGLASETFEETLGLLAARLAEIEELERFIRENGRSYTTTTAQGDVMCRPYPEVAMLNEARRHAQSLAAEFGLTPASIGRVGRPQKGQSDENPWGAFGG